MITVLVIVLVNVIFWGGGLWLAFAVARRHTRSLEERGRPRLLEVEGLPSVQTQTLTEYVSKNQVIEWTQFSIELPAEYATMGLVAAETVHLRKALGPSLTIETFGMPDTPDDVFDGLFDFSAPAGAREEAMTQDDDFRVTMLELHEAFGNVWLDRGVLRVLERDAGGKEAAAITVELLAQFRRRLAALVATDGVADSPGHW